MIYTNLFFQLIFIFISVTQISRYTSEKNEPKTTTTNNGLCGCWGLLGYICLLILLLFNASVNCSFWLPTVFFIYNKVLNFLSSFISPLRRFPS